MITSINIDKDMINKLKAKSQKENKSVSKIVEELINLGWANNWKHDPEIIRNCTHEQIHEQIGKSLHKYSCVICGYSYFVDSSD